MLTCSHCNFKFILVYPLGQTLTDRYNNVIKCPVCTMSVIGFTESAQHKNYNRMVVEE